MDSEQSTDVIDRLFPECQFCQKRSAVWVGKRCPFCWRHPDYAYDRPVHTDTDHNP